MAAFVHHLPGTSLVEAGFVGDVVVWLSLDRSICCNLVVPISSIFIRIDKAARRTSVVNLAVSTPLLAHAVL